jgi:hypothetical protein
MTKTPKVVQPTVCPQCGDEDSRELRTCLTYDRKLRKECPECGWHGEPYTPEKKPVTTMRTQGYFQGGYWVFETFDQYGQPCTHSQGYGSEATCTKAAKENLANINGRPGYGKCQAIVWPPTVKVVGKKVRG